MRPQAQVWLVLSIVAVRAPLLALAGPAGGSCDGNGEEQLLPVPMAGSLEHWAHPLLRRPLFEHLADKPKNNEYAAALQRELVAVTSAKLARLKRGGGRRNRRVEITLLEFGTAAWSVAAEQILYATVRAQVAAANATLKFRAVVIAQEECFARIARATVARHGQTERITVLHAAPGADLSQLRDEAGAAVELTALPMLDLVVCDGFGRPDTRLLEQAALLHALHAARRLSKPVITLPSAVQFHVMAVESAALRRRFAVGTASGLDMSVFDVFTRSTAARMVHLSGARDLATVLPLRDRAKLGETASDDASRKQQPEEEEEWVKLSEVTALGPPVPLSKPAEFYTLALSELSRVLDGE